MDNLIIENNKKSYFKDFTSKKVKNIYYKQVDERYQLQYQNYERTELLQLPKLKELYAHKMKTIQNFATIILQLSVQIQIIIRIENNDVQIQKTNSQEKIEKYRCSEAQETNISIRAITIQQSLKIRKFTKRHYFYYNTNQFKMSIHYACLNIFIKSQTTLSYLYQELQISIQKNILQMSLVKSTVSYMNKSATSFKEMINNTPEKNQLTVVKKIVMISSLKKEVKKIILKLIDNGPQTFSQDQQEKLMTYSKTILDNDKQKELYNDLVNVSSCSKDLVYMYLNLIKYFVISPVEKSYIAKIQKELKEDEELQAQIKSVEVQINEEKKKYLEVYTRQKEGLQVSRTVNVSSTVRIKENMQNKLMRANQKLNQLSSNNNKLRQRINQLRKQKNAMEKIYSKLKKQLEKKKQNVDNIIKYAGDATDARNQAQEDLKTLKLQAEQKKQQFKNECQKLNKQIQHDIRFKQFIKSKQIEKEQLQKLQEQIRLNQQNIQMKKQSNNRIDNEYQKSLQKEIQIKKSFERIKKQIGIGDVGNQNQGRQLLNIFLNLYEKNSIMNNFVDQLTQEVEELENRIQSKKAQIHKMYLKGTADHCDREKLNEELKKKFQYQERKRKILDKQYEKSVETINIIKKYLEEIFEQIDVDPEITEKLKNSNINEDNLTEFLGQLEKKGLQSISHYGKLVGQQLRAEKGNNWEINRQIDQLNNIITLQNVNSMNNATNVKSIQYPTELISKVKDDKCRQQDIDKPLSIQELKKFAIESLQQYQKKPVAKQKEGTKKFNAAPMNNKTKKLR